MSSFKLKLLGLPSFVVDNKEDVLPAEHPLLLLTYLTAHDNWIPRQDILELFYTDEDESVARNKLRQLLFRAKKQTWFAGFEANPKHLKHSAETDLRIFRAAAEEGDWQGVVDSYGGSLLETIPVTDLPSYEAWLDSERQDIDSSFEEAVLWHAKASAENGDFEAASEALAKLLDKDPLHEEALQIYLQSMVQCRDLGPALERYERFKALLAKDLKMTPLPETTDLVNQLIDAVNKIKLQQGTEQAEVAPTRTLQNIPKGLSPFVGRDPERAHLVSLLEQPETRLLSLLGIGGIGKTRLAIEVARDYADKCEHGAVFVALASTASADYLASTLLTSIGLEPDSKKDAGTQVIEYLKDKDLFLVLDNFEHLITAKEYVQTLLEEAPNLKLLVTTRERLNLSQEQIFELTGMMLPASDELDDLEAYDGIGLFLRAARRNDPKFKLTADNQGTILELCQLLEGVPLALELAASWLRLMNTEEILDEAKKSFDLIESDFADLPTRHQSLRAVFDSSWKLLTPDEQTTLVELSVFRGGFTLEAARQVGSKGPRTLLKLVNKSLIRRTETGRFEFLEVIRQYAFEKLLSNPEQTKEVLEKHANYYAALAKEAEPHLKGSAEQLEWLDLLEDDHSNLRKALEYLIASKNIEEAYEFANNLFQYWFIRGYWTEAQASIELISSEPKLLPKSRAKSLSILGYLHTSRGHYQQANELLDKSLEIYQGNNNTNERIEAFIFMGANWYYQGNYDLAEDYYLQGLSLLNKGEELKYSSIRHGLANVYLRKGNLERARVYFEDALSLREKHQDLRGAAKTLNNLGVIARRFGEYEKAEQFYLTSLKYSRMVRDAVSIADCLNSIGVLAKAQGRYDEADKAYQESLKIYKDIGDQFGEAIILENLGTLARLQNDFSTSEIYYEMSLSNHRERNDEWGCAKALNGLGIVTARQSKLRISFEYLKEGQALALKLNDAYLQVQNAAAFSVLLSLTTSLKQAVKMLAHTFSMIDAIGLKLSPFEEKEIFDLKLRFEKDKEVKFFSKFWEQGYQMNLDDLAQEIQETEVESIGLRVNS